MTTTTIHTRRRTSPAVAGPVPAVEDWRNRRACTTANAELWFAVGHSVMARRQIQQAKTVCNTQCPVRQECLSFAMSTGQDSGVWGGMTELQRRALRRKDRTREMGAKPRPALDKALRHLEDIRRLREDGVALKRIASQLGLGQDVTREVVNMLKEQESWEAQMDAAAGLAVSA